MGKNKLTNEDLEALGQLMGGLLDKQTAVLVTKEELKIELSSGLDSLEVKLKTYIEEGIETVMTGMDNLSAQMADKETQDKLVDWAKEAGEKIGVKPKF